MSTPEIAGYTFTEQLLEHSLATVWRGHSVTGMEVVALVLSDAGATDAAVRDRLAQASRTAALEPGRAEAPLWAANLNAAHPYAITQLAPGYSGAERLLDPLDGVIGNDQSAITEVRSRLDASVSGYAATRAPSSAPGASASIPSYAAEPAPPGSSAPPATALVPEGAPVPGAPAAPGAAQFRNMKLMLAAIVLPFVMFIVMYSVGAQVNSAAGDKEPTTPRQSVPAAVEPSPIPTKKVLLPGIQKAGEVPLRANVPPSYLVGSALPATTDTIQRFGLPFAMHDPGPQWISVILEESSYSIYRRLMAGEPGSALVDIFIAAHPCKDRAGCLADRAEFDKRWTSRFHAKAPATAKDAQTWVTETKPGKAGPYEVSMTRMFFSPATQSWWLVGVDATAKVPKVVETAQAVLNDIRTQIS